MSSYARMRTHALGDTHESGASPTPSSAVKGQLKVHHPSCWMPDVCSTCTCVRGGNMRVGE